MFGKTATRKWVRAVVIGLALFILSFYVLLVTGFFGQGLGKIVSGLVSNDSVTVTFSGLSTDIFRTTSADTVTVTTRDGLRVEVSDVHITGSLISYLITSGTEEVTVERLEIDLPPPTPEMEADEPESLSVILNNIDAGIAVSTEELTLNYGVITGADGTVLDSMYLVTSVDRSFGVVLDVDSAAVTLPDLGRVGGHGVLSMIDLEVSTDGFLATLPFGNIELSGKLSGPGEYLDAYLSGSAETGSFHLPLDLSCSFRGHLYGILSSLDADLSIFDGQALLLGEEADFSVDTIMADLGQVTVRGLQAATDHAQVVLNGEFSPSSLEWSADFRLDMNGMDVSLYSEEAPEVSLNGYLTGDLTGRGASPDGGWARIVLDPSTSEYVSITNMDVQASVQGTTMGIDGTVETGGGGVTLQGEGHLERGIIPVSWTARLNGDIRDFSELIEYLPPDIPQAGSVRFALQGSGTRFGVDMQGNIRVQQLESDFGKADAVSFGGSMNWTGPGPASSDSPGLSLNGLFRLEGLSAEGAEADTASFDGTFSMVRGEPSAEVSMLIDSLRFASDAFQVSSYVILDGDYLSVENLTMLGSGDRIYSAEAQVAMGDTTFLDVMGIRASHSKLRVVTDGTISAYVADGAVVIDTLWIDPPVGDLSMSGELGSNVSRISANIYNIDLSSFSTFSGLPADMSGTGNFTLSWNSDSSGVRGSLKGEISSPSYGQFSMDSITVDMETDASEMRINGLYAWQDGVRSGLQMRLENVWSGSGSGGFLEKIAWLEMEVNNLGDWLFYALPLPVRTMNASVSARMEYEKYNGDNRFEMQASARIERLYITLLGIELPNVNFYLSYPDSSREGYNTRFTLGSGSRDTGDFSSGWYADIGSVYPFEIGDYTIGADLSEMEVSIPGIGAVICSGAVSTSGNGLDHRPLLSGKLRILQGAVGIPQTVSSSSTGGSGEMPFDMSIDVAGSGDIWFRTSFADIELSLKMRIFTLERKPTVNGTVSAVRGRITLLQRDFQITEGTVTIIQGDPPEMQLNVSAETTVRSAVTHDQYNITVRITGNAEKPEINLSGTGPGGPLPQEDILTLLAAGLTYGEMQQLNSAAIRSEVENVAQSMLGSLLARNIRQEIGLDTFEMTPELLSDTTSLVLNVGEYVLPDLYVSYKDDVFSSDPGTVSAQFLFSSDFYIEGSTRTTVHGNLEPTIELHYTIRY